LPSRSWLASPIAWCISEPRPRRRHAGALGLEFEDIALTTSDGVRLHAWFVPAPGTPPVVLFLHGNAGNISHRLDKLAVLTELGAAVMLLDYRGYGRSEGAPDEDGTYRDADAASRLAAPPSRGGAAHRRLRRIARRPRSPPTWRRASRSAA
jgi:pimeloyl-ACP methyl ester carboxylesterase